MTVYERPCHGRSLGRLVEGMGPVEPDPATTIRAIENRGPLHFSLLIRELENSTRGVSEGETQQRIG